MSTPKTIAFFETTLSSAISSTATSFTLTSANDKKGTALATNEYGFVIDEGTASEEIVRATCTGTACTSALRGVDVVDGVTEVVALQKAHRRGASVKMTDAPLMMLLASKEYVDGVALAGAPDADATTKGVVEAATLAEVRARTATGSTGAALAVTPDVLDDLPTEDEKAALAGGGDFGTPSATNKYLTELTQKPVLTSGATINGASLPVPVYQNKSDNEFYACDGNDTAAMKFVGFAVSNSTDGNPINVQFTGVVDGFTGLSEGEKYYLSDTVGTISTTIGTYEVLVGIAISETQLLIQKGRRYGKGVYGDLGTATGSTTITCGFRPSVIRIRAQVRSSNGQILNTLDAVWSNGTIVGLSFGANATSAGYVNSDMKIYEGVASGDYMTFSLDNITDTSFDIVWTETGTWIVDFEGFIWEAEGEL